jgi:hypothetical protein
MPKKSEWENTDIIWQSEAYQSEATYTTGNKSTHQMIAMEDVERLLMRNNRKLR